MQSEMKSPTLWLLVLWVLVTVGCSRPSQPLQVQMESQAKVALKQALIEARLMLVDTNTAVSNVCVLRQRLAETPPLTVLRAYGLTNLLFNPDIGLWRQDAAVLPEVAMAVQVSEHKYLFVRFDWSIGETQDFSKSWLGFPKGEGSDAR